MSEFSFEDGIVLVAFLAWTAIVVVFTSDQTESSFQNQAVERGYAEFCQSTGDWAWKGECELSATEGK